MPEKDPTTLLGQFQCDDYHGMEKEPRQDRDCRRETDGEVMTMISEIGLTTSESEIPNGTPLGHQKIITNPDFRGPTSEVN
ncbi:Hypothetical protein SMAX5B_016016 [Scophthalmus maximus]|uniref:Uncharacterized protein n=1 Tax=Scophthalmus maximus TaxID=52904 RepID=A0A2U9CS18_SCOMX|nr:Hypothetical protein SMAX5B_016016 [Scophthalmus maximus]